MKTRNMLAFITLLLAGFASANDTTLTVDVCAATNPAICVNFDVSECMEHGADTPKENRKLCVSELLNILKKRGLHSDAVLYNEGDKQARFLVHATPPQTAP